MLTDRDLHRLADLVAARVLEAVQPKEVLTVKEAAALLQMHPNTVSTLARTGQIPARRLGEQWRFTRTALLDTINTPAPDSREI